jgi:hypothetical protein
VGLVSSSNRALSLYRTCVDRCIRYGKVGICECNGQTHETQRRTLQNALFEADCRCGRQLGLELLVATSWTTVDRCIRHGKVGICECNGQTRKAVVSRDKRKSTMREYHSFCIFYCKELGLGMF